MFSRQTFRSCGALIISGETINYKYFAPTELGMVVGSMIVYSGTVLR